MSSIVKHYVETKLLTEAISNKIGTRLPASKLAVIEAIGKSSKDAPGKTATEVIQITKCDPMTTSQSVATLKKAGFVKQTRSATDGRAKILSLTEKGLACLRAIETTRI